MENMEDMEDICMRRIVIATLPMRGGMEKRVYPVDGNALIESEKPIYFAVNPAATRGLKKGDEVKIVLLQTKGGDNAGEENAKLFSDEFDSFNEAGAKVQAQILSRKFDESKTNFRFTFKNLIEQFEAQDEIFADVTYGPKPLTVLIFSAILFAEKCLDCQVRNIVYSKVEFAGGKVKEGTQKIYDITALYQINSFTNLIDCADAKSALKAMDVFLETGNMQ